MGQLNTQRVIPVRSSGLVCASDWVFMPLEAGDAYAPPATDLDEDITGALRFVDDDALFPIGGPLTDTEFRQALTTGSPPIIREPHYLPLLQHAVAPALRTAVAANNSSGAARVLQVALRWIPQVPASSNARLVEMDWIAPAADGSWLPARDCYVGAGWTRGRDREVEPLLAAVYGSGRVLPSWTEFRERFGLLEDAREATLATLVRLGVATQPRILRAGKAVPAVQSGHQGPLLKHQECPFAGVHGYWDTWLGYIMRQPFNWRRNTRWMALDATWLDGLENPGNAEVLGAWVTRHPESYVAAAKTQLRPDGYSQLESVGSAWIYTLRRADPQIVPTSPTSASRGQVCRPSEACHVLADQRRKAGMGLLNLTAEALDETIRVNLGIVTLASAPAGWLIRVLRRLAADGVSKDSRGLEALLQRLWGRLNGALASASTDAVQRELVAEPMPVWRGKRVVVVDLKSAATIYIDDEPLIARHIKGFERAVHLRPSRAETEWIALSTALSLQLGEGKVLHTSRVEPDVEFQPDGEPTPLIEWLERRTRMPGKLRADLAVLLRLGARAIGDDRAKAAFRRFLDASVQFGVLVADGERSHWRRNQKLLAVSKALKPLPDQVMAESWQVVGEDWREVWMAFGRALAEGRAGIDRFFRERRIGEDARDEVRLEFGLDAERLRWLQPVLFALWARARASASRSEFEKEFSQHAAEDWAAWLEHDGIAALVSAEDGEDRPEDYVHACGVTWSDWQAARRALGLQQHRFQSTRDAFRQGVEHIVACGLALATEQAAPDVDVVWALRGQKPSNELLVTPPTGPSLSAAWTAAMDAAGWTEGLIAILDPVVSSGLVVTSAVPEGCDAEVVGEYRDQEQASRERRAGETWNDWIAMLKALARHRGGEAIDDALAGDPCLAVARSGRLANRALLRLRLATVLPDLAPTAWAAISAARLLDSGKSAVDLRLYALSLVPPAPPPAPPRAPPPPQVAGVPVSPTVAGVPVSVADTRRLMEALAASIVTAEAMDALVRSCQQRQALAPPVPQGPGGGGGGGGGGGRRHHIWRPPDESEDSKRATGLGGELFVFQQFRSWLPGFDEECWKSSGRSQAGVAEGGDDGLGYDFEYVDATGRLGRRAGARCRIEVKASKGSADATFPMSRNEWRVAMATHASESDLYIIVRVENVASAPSVVDILRDPFGMFRQGFIQLGEKDLWVSVAAVQTEGPTAQPE